MKRLLFATTLASLMALSGPAKAIDGCVPNDREHDAAVMHELHEKFGPLLSLSQQAQAALEKEPSDQNLALVRSIIAMIADWRATYYECQRIAVEMQGGQQL